LLDKTLTVLERWAFLANLTLLKPKVDALDLPRRHHAQQFAKHLPIVHA
jgi:hypothetical protein